MSEKTAKLADVARAAGVSQGTASNVFNRPDVVREEVREKVLAAAKKIGYGGPITLESMNHVDADIAGGLDHVRRSRDLRQAAFGDDAERISELIIRDDGDDAGDHGQAGNQPEGREQAPPQPDLQF